MAAGNKPTRITLDVTQGDQLILSVTNGGEAVPTPATFWWPDGTAEGKSRALVLSDDSLRAALILSPAEVDALIDDIDAMRASLGASERHQRPQIDLGVFRTVVFDPVNIYRTDRPNLQEESNV